MSSKWSAIKQWLRAHKKAIGAGLTSGVSLTTALVSAHVLPDAVATAVASAIVVATPLLSLVGVSLWPANEDPAIADDAGA